MLKLHEYDGLLVGKWCPLICNSYMIIRSGGFRVKVMCFGGVDEGGGDDEYDNENDLHRHQYHKCVYLLSLLIQLE